MSKIVLVVKDILQDFIFLNESYGIGKANSRVVRRVFLSIFKDRIVGSWETALGFLLDQSENKINKH